MRIFISHSWKDKTIAQMTADSLAKTAEVWLDLKKLLPGEHIQNAIDAAIKEMDFIILFWSKDAASSANVLQEIATAKRQGVGILPCLLDDTPLSDDLQGLLCIEMKDQKLGLFRIQIAVLRKLSGDLNMQDAAALNDLKDYEGVFNYINDYRNSRGISGEDASYWALKSIEATNNSFESLGKWRDRVGGLLQVIQTTMQRVEEAGQDRAKLQAILDELIRDQYRDSKELKLVISFVEGKIKNLPPAEDVAAPEADKFDRLIGTLKGEIAKASRGSIEQLRQQLAPYFPLAALNQSLDALNYYLVQAPESLREFRAACASSPSASLKQLAAELFNYLTNPNDIIPDGTYGLLGYLDDAWLIHNSIYRCIEAGLLKTGQFSADWNKIVLGDQVALHVFPPQIRSMLDNLMTQYLMTLAREVQQYQPSFSQHPSQENQRAYNAFMGNGAAAGGGSPIIQNAQSIDDIYYTVGGKIHVLR